MRWIAILLLGFSFTLHGQTHISFSGWKTIEVEGRRIKEIIQEFQKKNPDIVVDYQPIPENYNESLTVRAKSGNLPDIFYVRDLDFNQMQSDNYLLELNGLMQKYKIKPNMFMDGLIETYSVGKKNYGIPKDFNLIGWLVNENYRIQADLDPKSLTDWTEMRTWIQQLYQVSNKTNKEMSNSGLSLSGMDFEILSFNINHSHFSLTNKKILPQLSEMKTITFYIADLQKNDFLKPSFNNQQMIEGFGEGKISSLICGIWFFPLLKEKYPNINFRIYPIPNMMSSAEKKTLQASVALAVASNSKHADAAFRFITFYIDQFNKNDWLKNGMTFPPLAKQIKEIKSLKKDNHGAVGLLKNSGKTISLGQWSKQETQQYIDYIKALMFYHKSPEQIMTEIEKAFSQ